MRQAVVNVMLGGLVGWGMVYHLGYDMTTIEYWVTCGIILGLIINN